MEMIMNSLCIAPLCLTLSSIYSFINPQCALPLSLFFAPTQNKEASIYANYNPNCVLLPHFYPSVTENKGHHLHSRYDVFLNHRGADVKESVASLLFHNLQNKGFKVFLDKNSIQVGENIPEAIEEAIYSSNVHLVIFSANYAESIWCLKELEMILKTGAPIIPVFSGVQPSELRMRDGDSLYAQAFHMHNHTGNFEPHTLEEWKRMLYKVSYIKGYIFTGDQGELLEQIAMNIAELVDKIKFQPKGTAANLKEGYCPHLQLKMD